MQLINHIIYALELFMIICPQKSATPPKAAHATAGSIITMSAHNLSTLFANLNSSFERNSIILKKMNIMDYFYHFLVNVMLAFQPLPWLYPPPKLSEEFFASKPPAKGVGLYIVVRIVCRDKIGSQRWVIISIHKIFLTNYAIIDIYSILIYFLEYLSTFQIKNPKKVNIIHAFRPWRTINPHFLQT